MKKVGSSYQTDYRRLLSLESKIKKDVSYAEWISKKINEYVMLLNVNKSPPKQRIIFDFAAKTFLQVKIINEDQQCQHLLFGYGDISRPPEPIHSVNTVNTINEDQRTEPYY